MTIKEIPATYVLRDKNKKEKIVKGKRKSRDAYLNVKGSRFVTRIANQ